MGKVSVLGIAFDNKSFLEFQNDLIGRLNAHLSTLIVTANPEIVMAAQHDRAFKKIIDQDADLVTADGIGIIKGAKMLKTPLKERVTGYDLFTWLLQVADQRGLRVFFIGAKPEVIAALKQKIATGYPNLVVVGAHDGYFKESLPQVAQKIAQTSPDLVFAALGFPRQEELLALLRRENLPAVMMGVGGSFDVFSGQVKRAPKLFQSTHLEWFYRLLTHPTRWRRMLALPKFVFAVRKSKSGAEHR